MCEKIPRKCDVCGEMTTYYQHDFRVGDHLYCITKCEKCKEKEEQMDEWKNEQFMEKTMICPWCEIEFDSYENVYEEGEDEVDCPYCGKRFEFEAECRWTWTTRKPERFYTENEKEGESDE